MPECRAGSSWLGRPFEFDADDAERRRSDVLERMRRTDGQPPRAALSPNAPIDFRAVRQILDEVGGILVVEHARVGELTRKYKPHVELSIGRREALWQGHPGTQWPRVGTRMDPTQRGCWWLLRRATELFDGARST